MKKVYIIHGWGANPQSNWFDWLKMELEGEGFEVYVPELPNTENPQMNEWLEKMKNIIKPDKDTVLIGHSLGVIAILRYLENIKDKIRGAVLVSGFPDSVGIPEIESFFTKPVNFNSIKDKAKKFIIINSDDDEYVPLEMGEKLRDGLRGEYIVFKSCGHIQDYEQPIIFQKVVELFDNHN